MAGRGSHALAMAVEAIRAAKKDGAPPAPRQSGLQRQVLALYREFLRVARAKPADGRGFVDLVREEFRRNAVIVPRKDTNAVEWYIRRGKRQLTTLKMSQVQTLSFYVKEPQTAPSPSPSPPPQPPSPPPTMVAAPQHD